MHVKKHFKPLIFTAIRSIATAGLLSACCLPAFAQPTAFTYQGSLNDGGVPASGAFDITFSLWNSASGPAQVGTTVTNIGVGVSNGLFTTTLDFGANIFTGLNLWLEIGVRTNGNGVFSTLLPRQSLTSTPYAITASNVTGSVSASQLTGVISSNAIGPGTITTTMLAAGAVGSNQLAANAVTTAALVDSAVTANKIAIVSNWFGLKIANPSPGPEDWFGLSVAVLGDDRLVIGAQRKDIGATDAGVVYLFKTNGTLLTTFTNPAPGRDDNFGSAITAVGDDLLLIGAAGDDGNGSSRGIAYLFSTNGTLVATFTNPFSGNLEALGASVGTLGNGRVLISADGSSSGIGSACLFRTNGTLLMTFDNPTPAALDFFGAPVVSLGTDRVLIGARGDDTGASDAGAAYLFNTNGTLLITFTNPTPANSEGFGASMAALGPDRVIIGALGAGAAYLFNTNGALLMTFTNPAPASGNSFGRQLASLGTDRIVILGPGTNAAYLFSTNGTLQGVLKDPANGFGLASSLCAVGTDRVLLGTISDDGGVFQTGVAYLFSAEAFTPGLTAQGVSGGAIDTISLADGAVTAAKLDSAIGVWTSSSNNVYRSAGNVGIGTASPQVPLHVVGDSTNLRLENPVSGQYWNIYTERHPNPAITGNLLFFPGPTGVYGYIRRTDGNYFSSSDARLKEDVRELDGVLERVLRLRPVSYRFKSMPPAASRSLGLIAQEVEPLFPEAVGEHEGMKAVAYSELVPVTISAIQELNHRLEKQLYQKETEITELKRDLEELREMVDSLARKTNRGPK